MTDKPNPPPPPVPTKKTSRGLVIPANWRETTAEHIGTIIGIVGVPKPPRKPPYVLPPGGRDVTAERVGTVMVIVGATAARKGTKPG